MKQIIRQYQATGQRERQRHEAITHTTDQQEVADALRKIPAWGIDYDEWVAVLMALHREYGAAGLAWLELGAKRARGGRTQMGSRSKRTATPPARWGFGTVFALAKRFGWERVTQVRDTIRTTDRTAIASGDLHWTRCYPRSCGC